MAPIGVNFFARTSSGKSTALKIMTSVYGDPNKLGSWNATRTALEISAMQANDGLLALDEFPSRPEPWRVSALMALGNGVGWARSNLALTLTQAHRWRTIVASSAERSIRHFMHAAGIQLPEGASVRMIDVPVRRWKHGLFADLHGHNSGQIFSELLANNAAEHHGHAGRMFIRWVIRQEVSLRNSLPARVRAAEDKIREHLSQDASASEIGRVLHALALVAVAGEYATECGVLPWPEGAAIGAVCRIAELWMSRRDGEMPDSTRDLLEKIRATLAGFCDLDHRGTARASAIGCIACAFRRSTSFWEKLMPADRGRGTLLYLGVPPSARDSGGGSAPASALTGRRRELVSRSFRESGLHMDHLGKWAATFPSGTRKACSSIE